MMCFRLYCYEAKKVLPYLQNMATTNQNATSRSQRVKTKALKHKINGGVSVVAQWLTNLTRNHEVAGSVPALAQRVNDPARCCELWCRLQTRLGSHAAVALA